MEEMIKSVIFLIAIIAGQILLVYLPYRLKRIEDGRSFDAHYVYMMGLGFLTMAAMTLYGGAAQQMPLTVESVMFLLVGGGVFQKTLNSVTPKTKE